MKVAIVGSGIAGMTTAWLLHRDHEVTMFEANDYVGGHTCTVDEVSGGRTHAVDTGFIVFNERTYPNFVRLLKTLGVAWQPSDMSFSVRADDDDVEYNGTSLDTLFAQRRNLVRPSFLRMVRQILRFNREATAFAAAGDAETTLGEFLARGGYGREFRDHYILPMGCAIWSADRAMMDRFPFRYFAKFFANHGMLSVDDRPQWLVIRGGSRAYVEPLTAPFRDRIRLRTPVEAVRRGADGVEVVPAGAPAERFDAVVLASHADQSLRMLADPTDEERAVLSAFPYQGNRTTLHTDASILPRRRRAWAAWNYLLDEGSADAAGPSVTYWMNRLQSLDAADEFCVTLNRDDRVDASRVRRTFHYEHPIYTREGVALQGRQAELCGRDRTFFCGAYWGFGFHEDGVRSALVVGEKFGRGVIA